MTTTLAITDRYETFADQQAAGISPTLEVWARAVADDTDVLELLPQLPVNKQQPNLVFAAARLHGAEPGDPASLHETLTGAWRGVRATIFGRSTQTNEGCALCATPARPATDRWAHRAP